MYPLTKFAKFDEYCKKCKHYKSNDADDPCDECLGTVGQEDTHKPINFELDTNVKNIDVYKYTKKNKIDDYLYEIYYDDLDQEFAKRYFKEVPNDLLTPGACSAVRSGDLFGRNLDWYYNNNVEFVVHTKDTIGIAGGLNKLSKEFVESNEYDDIYKILPFMLQDGMNKHGLTMCMNVVPQDKGNNYAIPELSIHAKINAMTIIRIVLDNFKTVREAAKWLSNWAYIFFPKTITRYGYELHYLMADPRDTFVLEILDGECKFIDITDKPYITNFYIQDVIFNEDGTVYTPASMTSMHDAYWTNHITKHGSGLERYNLIVGSWRNKMTKLQLNNLMNELTYSRAYRTSTDPAYPEWCTEFVGSRGLRVDSPASEYNDVINIASDMYSKRNRNKPDSWITTHSSIYNMRSLELDVKSQEIDKTYKFNFK